MAGKLLQNAGAGSPPDPEASAMSRFLQSLTDRQLQVMLGGLHQMFTMDEITRLNTDIEKIVTTVSKKAVIPALCRGLKVNARSIVITRPGSSNLYLEAVTKEVSNAIVRTIIEALEENQDSHKQELSNMTGKMETAVVSVDAESDTSSDTSLTSNLLVDHLMAYIPKASGSSFGHGIPANALDHQMHSFIQNLSGKSLQKIQTQDTRTKAALEVSKILFITSDRFLESSLQSQRAHTSSKDCSVERTPSDCLFKAFNLVNSVIDGIYEGLHSQYKNMDWMESDVDVAEILWYIACTTCDRTRKHLRDFSAVCLQKAPKFDPTLSPEDAIVFPGCPTPQAHLHKPSFWFIDEQRRREMVSMATFLDTMMVSLGLQSSDHLNSLEDISAAAERVDGRFSTAAAERFAKMLQLMLTERFCEKISYHSFLKQSFASEFICEFADESVKRLLRSSIAPRAASAATENLPTLVTPFRACPESFEFSRPPLEVFDDTIDLFSDVIGDSIMDKISELSDYELDAELSNAEETPDLVKSDRQHRACLTTWLVLRVLGLSKPTSSDLTKEASSGNPKERIERNLRELSAPSSAAKLEEVLHATSVELLQRFGEEGSLCKALNPQDSEFDEALMTALQKHLGADASAGVPETEGVKNIPSKKRKGIFFRLKMPKINIFQKKSRKDSNGGQSDQDALQSHRTAELGESSNATSRKEKPRKPSMFRKMFSCFRK
ncbi:hypothetical protein SRHO_G00182630 [Serrasalmus rhombeus]